MPSTRTIRSATGKNAADAITAWRSRSRAIYEKERFRAAVEAIPGPRVLCYASVTTVSGTSTRSPLLLPDGDYGPVIKLVETVAHLLVTSAPVRRRIMIPIDLLYAESAEAQEQFDVLHPGENEPTEELFLAFVTTRFPNVILQEITKESSLLWGSVNTEGNEEGADMNEIFISKGLVQVYLDTQAGRRACVVSDIQYAKVKRFVEFVLISTIIHEFGHCLTKYLFGSQFLTPYLPLAAALVGSVGEIGQDLEMGIIGCIAVLEWADPALFYSDATEQLWRVDKLLGWVKLTKTRHKWYILTDAQIDHVIEMVHHGYIHQIPFYDQQDVGRSSGKAIRAKPAGDGMDIIVHIEDEPYSALDPTDESEYFSGLGLPITLDPKAFRSETSGDRKF